MKLKCIGLALVLLWLVGCSRPAHVVWQKEFREEGETGAPSVAIDGSELLFGLSSGSAWQLRRYDRNGKFILGLAYPEAPGTLMDVAVCSNHDIVVLVRIEPPPGHIGGRGMFLERFSPIGDVRWQRNYRAGIRTFPSRVCLDTTGRIWVAGIRGRPDGGPDDIFVIRFDSLGVPLDSVIVGMGANGYQSDMLLIQSRLGIAPGAFVAARWQFPWSSDTSGTCEVVRLNSDLQVVERWREYSASSDVPTRMAVVGNRFLFVPSAAKEGQKYVMHLREYDMEGDSVHDASYEQAPEGNLLALASDRAGGIVGIARGDPMLGSGQPHAGIGLWSAWRYFRGRFSSIRAGRSAPLGFVSSADLAIGSDGNAFAVVVAQNQDRANPYADVRLVKIALPRYVPPPGIWLPNMYR